MKFKVGDRVRVKLSASCPACEGKELTIVGNSNFGVFPITTKDNRGLKEIFSPDALVKIEEPMNKYEDLKQRIEDVEAWDKDADDVINEIGSSHTLVIWDNRMCDTNSRINIYHKNPTDISWGENYLTSFRYTNSNQCSKLEAFKKALMWLLDNSDIPKPDKKKQDKIEKLEKRLEEIKEELEELK